MLYFKGARNVNEKGLAIFLNKGVWTRKIKDLGKMHGQIQRLLDINAPLKNPFLVPFHYFPGNSRIMLLLFYDELGLILSTGSLKIVLSTTQTTIFTRQ